MKKTISTLFVALVMSLFTFSATAQVQTYKAYEAAIMNYDEDGEELGWSEWVKCTNYYLTFNASNDMITVKFDRTANLHAYDFDDWEMNDEGNMEYTLYCTETKTGEEAIVTFVLSPDNEMLIILEDDEYTIGLKVKDAGQMRNNKGKASKGGAKKSSKKRR